MTKNQEIIRGFSSGLNSTISDPVTHTWVREGGREREGGRGKEGGREREGGREGGEGGREGRRERGGRERGRERGGVVGWVFKGN